jgi:predicted membrane-bound spermidine synthase
MLSFEILLTRLLSIRFGYHLAFAVISLALFGLTAGAVFVHFAGTRIARRTSLIWSSLAVSAALFAVSMPTVLIYLANVAKPLGGTLWDPSLISVYIFMSLPFFCVGITVCLLLTKSQRVPRLYASDLIGGGLGGIAIIALLAMMQPPAATFFISAASALAATLFALKAARFVRLGSALLTFVLLVMGGVELSSPHAIVPPLRDEFGPFLFEKWNSYSRVTVLPLGKRPFGWGYSSTCARHIDADQYLLWIDKSAASPITQFSGNFDLLWHLDCDVTNAVHSLRSDQDVLVIGLGGGRDLLSALRADHRSVTAVEMNDIIVTLLEHEMAEFSGNITRLPRVRVVEDEARSYVRSTEDKYDIIQASMVDTFAAATSGAYSLTENNLYTVEAFVDLLQHLNDDGILTMSRWYQYHEPPFEMLRTAAVARAALERLDIDDAASRITIISGGANRTIGLRGVGTILVKKQPFTGEELQKLRAWGQKRKFLLAYMPDGKNVTLFDELLKSKDPRDFYEALPLDVSPTTDDSPFFFLMRIQGPEAGRYDSTAFLSRGFVILKGLLLVSMIVSLLVILVPIAVDQGIRAIVAPGNLWGGVFFLSIGLAFMLVEIAQIQRLTLLLGHPTYSLSVVLSSLLVASGVGSYMSDYVVLRSSSFDRALIFLGGALVGTLLAVGYFTRPMMELTASFPLIVRIGASVLMVVPMGILMGMLFPIGMSVAQKNARSSTAWFWALNGAASVIASVLATYVSAIMSISSTFLIGAAIYFLAVGALRGFHKAQRARVPAAGV